MFSEVLGAILSSMFSEVLGEVLSSMFSEVLSAVLSSMFREVLAAVLSSMFSELLGVVLSSILIVGLNAVFSHLQPVSTSHTSSCPSNEVDARSPSPRKQHPEMPSQQLTNDLTSCEHQSKHSSPSDCLSCETPKGRAFSSIQKNAS